MVAGGGGRAGGRGRRNNSPACFWLKSGNTAPMRGAGEGREGAVAVLRERALDGCLTLDTFAGRVDAAYRAKTVEELDALVADLPHEDGWRGVLRRIVSRPAAREERTGPPAPPPEGRGAGGPAGPRARGAAAVERRDRDGGPQPRLRRGGGGGDGL